MDMLGILFPRMCLGCGALGVYVCGRCAGLLKPIPTSICFYCRAPSPYGLTHVKCKRSRGVDGFVSIFYYNNFFKKVIKTIKYYKVKDARTDIYYLMGRNIPQTPLLYYVKKYTSLIIVPIPLFASRQRQRGFNQAELISTHLSKLLSIQQNTTTLTRVKDSPMQTLSLTNKQRRANVRGAFYTTNPPQHILLVDDVVTTGATTQEATRRLKEGGVKTVVVFSVAKG